jgi:hypothetical protein
MTRLFLGDMLVDVGRRLVESGRLQGIASRTNNDVECIIKSFK